MARHFHDFPDRDKLKGLRRKRWKAPLLSGVFKRSRASTSFHFSCDAMQAPVASIRPRPPKQLKAPVHLRDSSTEGSQENQPLKTSKHAGWRHRMKNVTTAVRQHDDVVWPSLRLTQKAHCGMCITVVSSLAEGCLHHTLCVHTWMCIL